MTSEDSVEAQNRTNQTVDGWRDSLLSLDRRQRLLYFKHTKTSSLELLASAESVSNGLHSTKGLELVPQLVEDDMAEATTTRTLMRAGRGQVLVRGKDSKALDSAVRTLVRSATTAFVDRGIWVLYAGLGMINWIDAQKDDPVESPLLLVPVRVTAGNATNGPRIIATEDDAQVNPSWIAKMERDFGIVLADLDADRGVAELMTAVAAQLPEGHGFGVQDRAVVAPFTFHKEAMYRDLDKNRDTLLSHELLQLLALGPESDAFDDAQFEPISDEKLDESPPPEDLFTILDSDGSQRRCLLAALDGRSFVMDGPPGTGKSQTIANIIAELIYRGKSVLFVSEKAAALDVVRNRLDDAGLGPFILELHSHNATRKAFAQNLGSALNEQISASASFGTTKIARLASSRRDLSAYAQAMNEQRQPLDRSLHEVLGILGTLTGFREFAPTTPDPWSTLSSQQLARIEDFAAQLSLVWKPVELGDDFLWNDVSVDTATGPEVAALLKLVSSCLSSLVTLREVTSAAAADLGLEVPLDVDDAADLAETVELLETRPQPVPGMATAELDRTLATWLSQPNCESQRRAAEGNRQALVRAETAATKMHGYLGEATPPSASVASALESCGVIAENTGPAWVLDGGASSLDAQGALELTDELAAGLDAAQASATFLASNFGIDPARVSPARSRDMARLAQLAEVPDKPESPWFNPALHQQLAASHATLQQLVFAVTERQSALSAVFTDEVLALPLDQISVRVAANKGFRRLSKQSRDDRKTLKAVTVQGRVGNDVIAMLPEAAAWQQADQALRLAEERHAADAGHYYQGTATDFAQLGRALETARLAVEYARDELNPDRLAQQLSASAIPDPTFHKHAERLTAFEGFWGSRVLPTLGQDLGNQLAQLPFDELRTWLQCASGVLREQLQHWTSLEASSGRTFNAHEVRQTGIAASELHSSHEGLSTILAAQAETLGSFRGGDKVTLDAADVAIAWAENVQRWLEGPITPDHALQLLNPSVPSALLTDALQNYATERHQLAVRFGGTRQVELDHELGQFDTGQDLLEDMANSADEQVPMWAGFNNARASLRAEGLDELVEQLSIRQIAAADVPNVILFAVLSAWVSCLERDDVRLTNYAADQRNGQVQTFKDLDREFVRTRAAGVINAAAERRPKAIGGPAGVIQREAQKKSRHLPIRELLAKAKDVALAVKPCFMMSPLAVSQYLPPNIQFDVVVFDEASQVLPEDAANCIYRGNQLIVAGDQKQLPPTDFFRLATADVEEAEEDYADLDDFQSLLDLCKAQGLPSLPLTWHYRSRHEGLIAFSNYRFYDGKLNTFPGSAIAASDLGVESFLVDGQYRRGAQRDNPVEARKVVDRVLFHLHHHPGLSIGVVAFSKAQEEAVLAELEARTQTNPELSIHLNSEDRLEGFFVKSLENVQGDERDIIVFTVGYGPDEAGKFLLNLGPLTRDGGWRRLNVAITRARKRVEIVHSVRPEDFPTGAKQGALALRQYLDYAMRGPISLAIDLKDSQGDAESPFEEDVLRTIRSWGYEAIPQVGTAGYRLDIGIVHPDHPGRYVLAVECDGAAYHSAKAARDRDRLREQILTGLGWRIHRIWGLSWYRDRLTQETRLREAIEASLVEDPAAPPDASVPREPTHDIQVTADSLDPQALPEWAEPFAPPEAVKVSARWSGPTGILDPGAMPELIAYIQKVVTGNTPIHTDLLGERIREDWRVRRAGSKIKTAIDGALARFIRRNPSFSLGGGFIRDMDRPLERVRVGADDGVVRSITQVPPEELDFAVRGAVRDAHEIGVDEVKQYVKALFGWSRLGSDIDSAIDDSVARLVAGGRIQRDGSASLKSNG